MLLGTLQQAVPLVSTLATRFCIALHHALMLVVQDLAGWKLAGAWLAKSLMHSGHNTRKTHSALQCTVAC
jgi:hypothetical protein